VLSYLRLLWITTISAACNSAV